MKTQLSLRERHRAKRVRSILEAAGRAFGEKGFSATRIEDIAARAEVAPATVYNYFGDKNGILIALFSEYIALQGERLVAAARKPFKDVLAAVDHFLDTALDLEQPSVSSELFRQAYAAGFARNPTWLADSSARGERLVHGAIVELFERHRARGTIPRKVRPRDLADVVFAIGTYHWLRWVNGEVANVSEVKPQMKRQCRLAVAGICGIDPGRRSMR